MSSTGKADSVDAEIRATIVTYENRPDECTLHPTEPEESERMTAWITAKQGSYVSPPSWR